LKILIISGTHSRHLFVNESIINNYEECAAIIMDRENILPKPPKGINFHDQNNFLKHFQERYNIEKSVFGELNAQKVFSKIKTLFCQPASLNSKKSADFVRAFAPDIAFIFGPDLIKDPLLNVLPLHRINLHLGLSPWYRGSATLFWPFYFLQPQFAGVTFHQILPQADAGPILHQSVPKLYQGDGIHDVGARAVVQAKKDLIRLLEMISKGSQWNYTKQKSQGKLFLVRDFHPTHLRLIYDSFDNKIVEAYLNDELENKKPKLTKAFND